MARHFDNELRDLKFSLLAMAGQVEEMILLTHTSLLDRSDADARRVNDLDKGVDELELRLDQACIDLLALRAPFASDLRLIASTLKIVPELERIGDHCTNIARRALILNPMPPLELGDALRRIGEETLSMVRRAVDAFVNGDAELARSVIASDDSVDALYVLINRELLRLMLADPMTIERASHLIIVIKNWERIADQATNIAEEVLFIIGGVSVKHPYLQTPPEG
ncbi:phosphate signaling complex protein PhoU [Mesoterricola silvestris]|uniref:Phosphate-specific transport system accessory protein PhoU n=1 Tax=Mesoterricola silvestris TaxID=2927979 RepID=A0AA48GHJ6_9BACT|nr:phosphate signaling complex protein PhoU [Mesoterricola silvestris]BDU73001.1 phosphate transport system regulatory protein PhoU [Mesoterricola silvestris]